MDGVVLLLLQQHATGELAVTPPLPPPGTEMVTVAPGSLETHGAIRPSASPNQK